MDVYEERFWTKVEKTDTCWLWQACRKKEGYGQYWTGSKIEPAHRVAYRYIKGEIPQGLVIDHLCRNPSCVNPEHLEAVTHGVNVRRGVGLSAQRSRQGSCLKGHPFDFANTMWVNNKDKVTRVCRACKLIRTARYRKENRPHSKSAPANMIKGQNKPFFCKRGHLVTDENAYWRPTSRRCSKCVLINRANFSQKRSEKKAEERRIR